MDSQKLARYFKNECTPAEEQEVLDWFKNESISESQEQDLAKIWEQEAGRPAADHDPAALLARIKTALPFRQAPTAPAGSGEGGLSISRAPAWQGWAKWAAAVLLPLCFLAFLANHYLAERQAAKLVVVETAPGKRKVVKLEDGSTVTLNTGSKLVFPQSFPDDRREISLEGEAFFKVAKDKSRPFIVSTGLVSTQALGTSFNIRYREREPDIRVALATGVVRVDRQTNQSRTPLATLRPDQQLVYNRRQAGFQVAPFNARQVLGWRKGILYFHQASLQEVVQTLESWYGVKIRLSGKIPQTAAEWNYTGEYNNQALEDVLTGISYVKDFTFSKQENILKINFK
ncbi:MAG: FecR family protein [Adhaeribacter sp.]